MTYEEFVRNVLRSELHEAGSISILAKNLNANPDYISKIIRGDRVPSEKTFKSWYPQLKFTVEKTINFE